MRPEPTSTNHYDSSCYYNSLRAAPQATVSSKQRRPPTTSTTASATTTIIIVKITTNYILLCCAMFSFACTCILGPQPLLPQPCYHAALRLHTNILGFWALYLSEYQNRGVGFRVLHVLMLSSETWTLGRLATSFQTLWKVICRSGDQRKASASEGATSSTSVDSPRTP